MDIPDEGSESKQPNEVRSFVGHLDSSEPARSTGDDASDFGKSAMQSTVVNVDQDSQIESDPLGRTRSAPFSGATAGVGNQCVGDFILLEVIGRGGMGVVYKARQLGINRLVALKMVLAGGSADRATLDRFRSEAEAAGKLDHPHIVPVYQFGVHQDHPYLAMGLVEGVSLKDRLSEGPLPVREAAEIVAKIARAIDYAHQCGVVHRDLKPHNILMDLRGEPRVTDFGLAKSLVDDSGMTATGQILGTPSFMPPEQARGEADRVTASADIYSLGATLYALLTGRPPFQGASVSETLLQVVQHEPIPPRRLQPTVSVDLETICLECLHKEPGRRYASAGALADDLERFLEGRPIRVRPIGKTERTWRWCRRNPVVASLAVATFVALLGGTITSTAFWIRALSEAQDARIQRDAALVANAKAAESLEKATQAESAARKAEGNAKKEALRANEAADQANLAKTNAEQVSEFLVSLFQTSDPLGIRGSGLAISTEEGAAVTAGELLQRGAKRIEGELAQQPLVKATLMTEIGAVYRSLGKYDLAEPLLKKGLELRERNRASPLEISSSMYHVAWLLHDRGQYADAESLYRKAIGIQAREQSGDGSLLTFTKLNLAWTLMDERKYVEAISLFRQVVEARRKQYGESHRQTVLAKIGLVSAMLSSGQERDALLYSMKDFGETDPVRAFYFYEQGSRQRKSRRFAEAEKSYNTVIDIARAHIPPDHPGFALLYGDFAGLLFEKGDEVAAEKFALQSLTIATNSLGNHPKMADPMRDLASHVARRGDFNQAAQLLDRALTICERFPVADASHVRGGIYREQLRLYRAAADYAHAEATGRKAVAWAEGRWNQDLAVHDIFAEFARLLREGGRIEEACDRWKAHIHKYEQADFGSLVDVRQEFVDFLRDAGRYREADRFRHETFALIEDRIKKLNGNINAIADIGFCDLTGWTDDRFNAPQAKACETYLREPAQLAGEVDRRLEVWGERLLAADRAAEAEHIFRGYLERVSKSWGKSHLRTCLPASLLARALVAQKKYPEAEARLRANLTVQRASRGNNDIAVSNAMCELADCLAKMGRHEAAALAMDSVHRAETALGNEHVWLTELWQQAGDIFVQCGRHEEAERRFRQSWQLVCSRFPSNHPRLLETALHFESFLESQGKFTDAALILSEVQARFRKDLPQNSWRAALIETNLGALAEKQEHFARAEKLLAPAHDVLLQAFGPSDRRVIASGNTLGRVRKTLSKSEAGRARP